MSKISIGIVGLPNVGKSTLFKLLTAQDVTIANYPFATIDPNVGVVPVPDERLTKIARLVSTKKAIPTVVEFFDIAGLVKGAHKGEGLGNQFLLHIRETNAILHIVRCFGGSEIIHVEGEADPVRDFKIIETELVLKDLETVTNRFQKAESDARSGSKEAREDRDALGAVKEELGKGIPLWGSDHFLIRANKKVVINELNLLTAKPQLVLLNGTDADVVTPKEDSVLPKADVSEKLKEAIHASRAEYIVVDLSSTQTIPELVTKVYEVLGLISFFTFTEDETRAWTTEKGTKVPQAVGTIHTDFENKFIRAEVINWQKLLEAGGWSQARQKGWLRLEGKEYVVLDGDVILVRHG